MTSLPELWSSLREAESGESAGEFRMRLCQSGNNLRVFAAVSGQARDPALVLEIPAHLKPSALARISGLRLTVFVAELAGLPPGRTAIVMQLRDRDFEDLFSLLGSEVVATVGGAATAASAVQSVVRVVERWRRFLERHRVSLSPEETRGLIGELSVLERLCVRIGAESALSAWKAPQGSIRDFECTDRTIEAKTFMASTGPAVRISSPEQLEPEYGVPLYLACQELARSQLDTHTLPGHIARVATQFVQHAGLAEVFEDALASAGYVPAHAPLYTEAYSLGPTLVLQVAKHFPRIHPDQVPAHVVHVQFSLQILQLSRFRVDPAVEIGPLPPECP